MLPEEIYATGGTSSNFQYSHPLSHLPVDDGALRARLAYDLMTFMKRSDCPYFMLPESGSGFDPHESDDEVDILIVDGHYKEAEIILEQRLKDNPDDDKALFQKAFIVDLKNNYKQLLKREDKILKNDPDNVSALINKGFALANLGQEEEAIKVADKVLKIDPDNLLALGSKAYIAKNLGKDEIREQALSAAYNISARKRAEDIARKEASLLEDFNSVFMSYDDSPISAFEEFNQSSSGKSSSVH